MVRQIDDCELNKHEEALPEIFPVMIAKQDRMEGRYGTTAINEVNQVELIVNCGLTLRRNLEMINLFSVAVPMPGLLGPVIDEWDCEQLRYGRPQPVRSEMYYKTFETLGQSTDGPMCLTSGSSCSDKCPSGRNVTTKPTVGGTVVK